MKPHFRLSLSFDGHINVQVAASPAHTAIVRSHQQKSLQVLLYGRLYYLEEVARRFGLPLGLDEFGLVLKLYQQEGPGALQALEGEFALAIADETSKTITLCRDPMGNYPLYWRQQGQAWVMSTQLKDLGGPGIAALNPDYIAQYLGYSFAFTELNSEQTIYQSCYRLQPGQGCQFSLEQAPRTLFQQDLIAQLSPISDITPSEAGEQFKQILTASTAARCQFGNVGAHLSGGMDSSAVVCLVPSPVKLTTLSLVYHLKTLVKETDYIQLMLEQQPRLNPVFVQADGLTDFQWFDFPLPDHDEPYAGLFHLAIETP